MRVDSGKLILAEFGPQQWTGRPSRNSPKVFFRSGFGTFLAYLILMIFNGPLRSFPLLVAVCTVAATIFTVVDIVSKAKREESFLKGLTAQVNGAILDITGIPDAKVSEEKLRELINACGTVPLPINGVPGVELQAEGKYLGDKRILAVATSPDYGLESFDRLLAAEKQRKT